MPRYKGNEKQNLMVPVNLRDQLIPGTIEHAIDWIIDHEVDTSGFDELYANDETGRRAYDPKALLKIMLYAYSKGILSSRGIEEACRANVVFMALSGDIHPDHATIARFISGRSGAIRTIFRDVLVIAAQGDLIGAEVFALDGCKISSNASKEHSGTHASLQKKVDKLEARLDAMIDGHRAHDRDEEREENEDDEGGPADSTGAKRYRAQIDRIKRFLQSHQPRIGVGGREVQSNLTDNESAKLKSSSGFLQGYNGLALVDSKHQIIVHAEPIGQISEAPLLPRMVRRSLHTLRRVGVAAAESAAFVADTNYFCEANARFFFDSKLDGYIPDNQFRNRDPRFADRSRSRRARHQRFTYQDFIYEAEMDTYRCPDDKQLRMYTRATVAGRRGRIYRGETEDCAACELSPRCLTKRGTRRNLFVSEQSARTDAQRMREKIDAPEARRMYSKRMGIIEPVFANITANKGMSRFTLRGRASIRIQWLYYTLVHNIEKIVTTGVIHSLAPG
jgi:transposase